jgi:hypothetical protein
MKEKSGVILLNEQSVHEPTEGLLVNRKQQGLRRTATNNTKITLMRVVVLTFYTILSGHFCTYTVCKLNLYVTYTVSTKITYVFTSNHGIALAGRDEKREIVPLISTSKTLAKSIRILNDSANNHAYVP